MLLREFDPDGDGSAPIQNQCLFEARAQLFELGSNRGVGHQQGPAFGVDRAGPDQRQQTGWQDRSDGFETGRGLIQSSTQIGKRSTLLQGFGQGERIRHGRCTGSVHRESL